MTDKEKLYQLIKTGNLENIELALAVADSNKIDLHLEPFENMYSWLVQNNNLSSGNYNISQKLVKIFTIKKLRLYHLDFNLEQIHIFLQHLSQLEELDIRDNSMTIVPSQICEFKNLNYLILSQNLFKELPSCFSKMKNLETIYLNNNSLESIPKELFELSHLKFLSLSYNQLKESNGQWGKLKYLKSLFLNSNHLEELAEQVFELEDLSLFNFSNNRIKKMPKSFFNLINLTDFNGCNNQITEIPKDISKLKKLTRINLSGNLLTTIPNEILDLPKLQELNLNHNPFSEKERKRIWELREYRPIKTILL